MNLIIIFLGVLLHHTYGENLVNVRLPFVNSAGVTYINGITPTGLVAAPVPLHYSQQLQAQPPVNIQQAHFTLPSPLKAAPLHVPVQHNIPAIADIPVTHIDAQPGVIQKLVDVANPAIKTRKYEVRRPAIQKQFFDIEERVIVRPAGSALVELDHPTSKNQKGADIITPLHPVVPVAKVHHPLVPAVPVAPVKPVFVSSTPVPHETEPIESSHRFDNPSFENRPTEFQSEEDTVVIEARSQQPKSENLEQKQQNNIPSFQRNQSPVFETAFGFSPEARSRASPQNFEQPQNPEPRSNLQEQHQFQLQQLQQSHQAQLKQLEERHIFEQQEEQRRQHESNREQQPQLRQQNNQPQVEVNPNAAQQPVFRTNTRERQSLPEQISPVIASPQISPAELHLNQQRLIQLLTEKNGITEIGNFDNSGRLLRSGEIFNDARSIRARVISATPAPFNARKTDERVNTRRVVISQPIETVQEVEVVEPATKIDRVAINEPAILKTARFGIQRIHTSIPAVSALPAHLTAYHH